MQTRGHGAGLRTRLGFALVGFGGDHNDRRGQRADPPLPGDVRGDGVDFGAGRAHAVIGQARRGICGAAQGAGVAAAARVLLASAHTTPCPDQVAGALALEPAVAFEAGVDALDGLGRVGLAETDGELQAADLHGHDLLDFRLFS